MNTPFNLQAAIDGKPLITRDGKPVKFIAYSPEISGRFKVMCLRDDTWASYTDEGKDSASVDSEEDLFMAPEKVVVWICHRSISSPLSFPTEEEAQAYAVVSIGKVVAITRVEFEKGEGVDI